MPEIYAYGIRNPQGLDINPATGELWESEFGPRGGDEVNIIRAGKNYGWPVITYGIEYSGEKVGDAIQQKDGMEQPVYYWDPVISPSGIGFYKGNAIPEWKNNLFIGSLSGQHIDRLVIKNNKVVGEERLLADKNERFRDIAYANEMLFAITDGGSLYRISKRNGCNCINLFNYKIQFCVQCLIYFDVESKRSWIFIQYHINMFNSIF